jgi:hypothetical protein
VGNFFIPNKKPILSHISYYASKSGYAFLKISVKFTNESNIYVLAPRIKICRINICDFNDFKEFMYTQKTVSQILRFWYVESM